MAKAKKEAKPLPTYQEAKHAWETLLYEASQAKIRWDKAQQECHELNQRVNKAREVIRDVLAQDGTLCEADDDY